MLYTHKNYLRLLFVLASLHCTSSSIQGASRRWNHQVEEKKESVLRNRRSRDEYNVVGLTMLEVNNNSSKKRYIKKNDKKDGDQEFIYAAHNVKDINPGSAPVNLKGNFYEQLKQLTESKNVPSAFKSTLKEKYNDGTEIKETIFYARNINPRKIKKIHASGCSPLIFKEKGYAMTLKYLGKSYFNFVICNQYC